MTSLRSNSRIGRSSTKGPLPIFITLFLLVLLCQRGSSDVGNDGLINTPRKPVCFAQDRQALLSFKASISSDPDKALSDWQASHHNCCHWNGVTCDGATGRVVRLNLFNHNLKGKLAPGLSALSSLQVLILDSNDFSGSIPSSFGNFSKLQQLSLSVNPSLSGPIPESFSRLGSLELLDLRMNALSGPLPASFGKMSNLRNLHLYGNKITGPIPPSFGLLSNLYSADLGSNQMSGRIPDAFGYGGLTSLVYLLLGNNRITGLPNDLRNLTSLQWIDLSNNPLMHGDAVQGIATMPLISQIELNSCNISGPFPTWVSRLPQPDMRFISDEVTPSLDLGNNGIRGAIPSAVGNLVSLEYLGLQQNQLSGSIPASFAKLGDLQRFNVSYNRLSGKIPQVKPFTSFDKLSYTPGNTGLCGSPLTPCK